MNIPVKIALSAATIVTLAVLAAGPALAAKSVKECNQEYALRKNVIDAAHESRSDFMANCRTRGTGEPTPIFRSESPRD